MNARSSALALALALAACAPPLDEPEGAFEVTFPDADGKDDAAAVEMPTSASTLMKLLWARARGYARRGTVPESRMLSVRNAAAPTALHTGPQIFPAMADLIEQAEVEVDFQTFVWVDDCDPAAAIFDGLRRLAARRQRDAAGQRPVLVRFLLDASTLGILSPRLETSLPRLARSLQRLDIPESVIRYELAAFPHETFGNLHSKTLIVDGRAAIVTGANVQNQHDFEAPWNDAGFRVDGDVALGLLAQFDAGWRKGQVWTCGGQEGAARDCTRWGLIGPHKVLPIAPALEQASVPMIVTSHAADPSVLSNRTDDPQDQAFLAGFENAQSLIRIMTPNLNDDAAKAGIIAAVQRAATRQGDLPALRVEILLAKGFNERNEALPGQGGPNGDNVKELYQRVSALGIDPCRWLDVRWYTHDGVVIEGNGPRASHVKYTSFDRQVVIVGTANMDTQSWNNAHEVNVVVDDAATTQAWDAEIFESAFRDAPSVLCGR